MEILLAVAVAVVAVTGWFTSSTYRAKIREHTAALDQASRRVADAERQLREHATVGESASRGLAEFRQQMERQLAEVGRDLARANQQLKDVGGFVRARLSQDMASTRTAYAHRVLIAALHTERPPRRAACPRCSRPSSSSFPRRSCSSTRPTRSASGPTGSGTRPTGNCWRTG